jgi:hypothetical protein
MSTQSYDDAFKSSSCDVLTPGKLHLPSGRVVACDPFFAGIAMPLAKTVRPGDYEVQLCRADTNETGKRIALARIVFQPRAQSVVYEKAILEDTDSTEYFVESGLGCFMDEETRKQFVDVMARHYKAEPDGNYYGDVLAAVFKKSAMDPNNPDDAGAWAVHELPGSQLNIVMFATGLGDGVYESFWGLNGNNEIVSLTTDFRILS